MKKATFIVLAIIIGTFGLMWWGRQNLPTRPNVEKPSGEQSSLTASEYRYDFGTISMAKGKVNYLFTITNPMDKDITLEDVATSCMCTAAYLVNGTVRKGPFGMPGMGFSLKANETIKARGTAAVDVVYDPSAHGPAGVGAVDRFVYLTEAGGKTLRLEIKALVTP